MSSEFSPQQQSLRLMGLLEQCVTWDKNEAAEYCTKVCKCLTEHQGETIMCGGVVKCIAF